MTNPFENIKPKDWLYVAGAFASIVALYFAFGRGGVSGGTNAVTDVPNSEPVGAAPNYMTYNMSPYDAPVLQSGADVAPNPAQCCCDAQCNSASPLADGSAIGSLLDFYKQINPQYTELQKVQLQRYAAYFATGESYSKGGIALGVSGDGSVA